MSLVGGTIEGAAGSATNTLRPLTHPSGMSRIGGLAVDATRVPEDAVALFQKRTPIPTGDGCLLFPTRPTARGYGQIQGWRTDRKTPFSEMDQT